MSLTQGPVRPPDIFADVKFWVEGSLAERDTIVSNIEIRGGKSVGTIHEAQYAVVRPTYSDDLRRTIASLGIPSIMASWIPQSIEAGHMLPASPFLPSTLSPAPSNPPVSTLQMQQKEAPSVSGESTAVDSPAHQGARVSSIHINGGPSNHSSEHSPVIPDDDAGESEIDELDQSLPVDSPNRKKRGKAYTAQDIADMRAHYRAQMELNPRPSHSAIWETFAYSVRLRYI
ncbi:hypothetical protein DL93DRAFT_1810422 [Clavulina sp. PMI_390]|nr:hypothetical protein DL93DRAFT_1810422 [Clavulina sp. PMI_390]